MFCLFSSVMYLFLQLYMSSSSTAKHFDILRLPLILIGAAEFAVASWFRVRKDCLRHFSIDYDAHGSILRASSDLLFYY